jgi:hypothetical protein
MRHSLGVFLHGLGDCLPCVREAVEGKFTGVAGCGLFTMAGKTEGKEKEAEKKNPWNFLLTG